MQPFARYAENPSWLAIRPLHNTVLYTQPEANPTPYNDQMVTDEDVDMPPTPQPIHITAVELPVTYKAVRSFVPGLHARPPVIPQPSDPELAIAPPPINGYDFILHTSVAGRGALRLEKVSHKLNYRMRDAEGQYAPTVHLPKEGPVMDESERFERERLLLMFDPSAGEGSMQHTGGERGEGHGGQDVEHQPQRGFGQGYESYPDELYTEIDVARLIHHLKESGVEVRPFSHIYIQSVANQRTLKPCLRASLLMSYLTLQQVYSSMDSGHYLCDYMFYCSLAESKRVAGKQEKDKATPPKSTPILAMHCGPVDQPLSTPEVTEAIKKIVIWVCARLG